jgi:hypothetical protein
MWRQASLPDVKGGILPPGITAGHCETLGFQDSEMDAVTRPPGWKPDSTAAKDGRRYAP